MADCRDCLHTPSGKCWKHDPKNADPFKGGLQLQQPAFASTFKERLFGPDDTIEDIARK